MNKSDIEQIIRLATKEHQQHSGYDFVRADDKIKVTGKLFGYRLYLYIDTRSSIDETFEFNVNTEFVDAVASHFMSEHFVAASYDASDIWIVINIVLGEHKSCNVTVGLGKTREFEYHSFSRLYTFSLDVDYVDDDDDCMTWQLVLTADNFEKLIRKSEEL